MSERKYSGDPIDMSWQTPPWQNDGETLDAYTSEGEGKLMTDDWAENATDREKLTEKEKAIIVAAANHPDVNSATKLAELASEDVSKGYPNNVLRRHWPDRYWGETYDEQIDTSDIDVEETRRRLLNGGSLRQIAAEKSMGRRRLSFIVRGVGQHDIPDCDVPPLEYNPDNKRWVCPDGCDEDVQTETDQDTELSDLSVEEIRRRALEGESATDIAASLDVSDAAIRRRLNGRYKIGQDSDIPVLEYDTSEQEWRIADDSEDEGEQTQRETPTPATPETRGDGAPTWVWAVLLAVVGWLVSKLLK